MREIANTQRIDLGKSTKSEAIHFSGLGAFRFIAAAFVVLVHMNSTRYELHTTTFNLPLAEGVGSLAVTFFFALSGFLITFLLLQEREYSGSIDISKFYWRRILRIWPLYYLVLFVAFSILNNKAIFPLVADASVYKKAPLNITLHLLFLPNVAWILGLLIPYANQLWSVGVEEQFYLFWPVAAKYLKKNFFKYFMICLIFGSIFIRNSAAFFIHYPAYSFISTKTLLLINNFLLATRISCMAIGGIGAYIYYFYPKLVQYLLASTIIDIFITIAIVLMAAKNIYIPYIMPEAFGLLFCYLIMSCSCKPGSILQLENKVWVWLGNISYGIYMWHTIILGVLTLLIKEHIFSNGLQADLLLCLGALPLTIFVAWLSYKYIEKPFLRLKKRFVVVDSRA